jgi:YHS domain-containing protein
MAFLGFLVGACAPMPPVPPENTAIQQCPVCRHHRDFGCLRVVKKPDTPKASHAGRTYWFCGESCRCDFEKIPERYTH